MLVLEDYFGSVEPNFYYCTHTLNVVNLVSAAYWENNVALLIPFLSTKIVILTLSVSLPVRDIAPLPIYVLVLPTSDRRFLYFDGFPPPSRGINPGLIAFRMDLDS